MKGNSIESSITDSKKVHIASIDILRALTMVLMIFVNDLWSLRDIPAWLGHAESGVDGIGLADVVFPAFLFMVGLSLPYAVDNRRKNGDGDWQLVKHIALRTFALLIMGVFLVNGETIDEVGTGMSRSVWNSTSCLCFILIWNAYPKTGKFLFYGLKAIGFFTLLMLAAIYRGGQAEDMHFGVRWWGILGLIGWAYLASGLVTVFAKNNFYVILAAWIFFAILSIVSSARLLPEGFSFVPTAISGGTLTGLTAGGVLISRIFQYYRARKEYTRLTIVLISLSLMLIALSLITRPYWGLSKLGATPAWMFLCSAFTILAFVLIYWLSDVFRKAHWFRLIKPAGTDTLFCYLMPYFVYATTDIIGINLPAALLIDGVGLMKSFLFALLCVGIAGYLIKLGIRLKL